MGVEVVRCRAQQCRVVPELAKAHVAGAAEKTAHHSGDVVMIDMQALAPRWLPTDRTAAVLGNHHRLKPFDVEAIVASKPSISVGPTMQCVACFGRPPQTHRLGVARLAVPFPTVFACSLAERLKRFGLATSCAGLRHWRDSIAHADTSRCTSLGEAATWGGARFVRLWPASANSLPSTLVCRHRLPWLRCAPGLRRLEQRSQASRRGWESRQVRFATGWSPS